MVVARGASGGKGYNRDHGSTQARQRVTIPGFVETTINREVKREPLRFGNMVIERKPYIKIETVFHTAIYEYEFIVKRERERWAATSPQVDGWKYIFKLTTPVSDIHGILGDVVVGWVNEGDGGYSQYDGSGYDLSDW